jgi:hypothetical protein
MEDTNMIKLVEGLSTLTNLVNGYKEENNFLEMEAIGIIMSKVRINSNFQTVRRV